jgi:hypothetical protein
MRPARAARGPREGAHGPPYAAAALVAVLVAGGVAGCAGSGAAPPRSTSASSAAPPAPTSPASPPATAAQGPAAQWASGLCAALAAWEASVRVQVTRPGPTPTVTGQSPSERLRGEVRARLNGVAEATDQLRSELERLGAPSTASGTAVKEELSALSARLRAHIAELQAMAAAPVSGVGELQAQASKVRDIVSTALADVQQSVNRVKSLDPAGELSTALASAPACQVLRHEQSSGTSSS